MGWDLSIFYYLLYLEYSLFIVKSFFSSSSKSDWRGNMGFFDLAPPNVLLGLKPMELMELVLAYILFSFLFLLKRGDLFLLS